MSEPATRVDSPVDRLVEWHHAAHDAVCEVVEPWTHGTVVRAGRYPNYFDYNAVRVENDPAMSAEELVAFADAALAGLTHRRLDFEMLEAAAPLREQFEARGWEAQPLLWMRHELPAPAAPREIEVRKVPYGAVHDLREAWHEEDFPAQREARAYYEQAREVALAQGAQVLAAHEGDAPVAFAQLRRTQDAAEITQVYVLPAHRGAGLGTAITLAAIEAAGEVRDLWICADDEGRPKELYARLGFRPVARWMNFQRWPGR